MIKTITIMQKLLLKYTKHIENLKFCIDIKKSQVYNADKDKGVTQISVMSVFYYRQYLYVNWNL